MTLHLTNLAVRGFKSIESPIAIDCPGLTVLVGTPGAGKTNILRATELVSVAAQGELRRTVTDAGGAHRLLHNGPRPAPNILIKVGFAHTTPPIQRIVYEINLKLGPADTLLPSEETATVVTEPPDEEIDTVVYRFDKTGAGEAGISSILELPEPLESLRRNLRTLHVHQFTHLNPHQLGVPHEPDSEGPLRPDAANLADVLRRLRHNHAGRYKAVIQATRLTAPFFEDFVLDSPDTDTGTGDTPPGLRWIHTGISQPLTAADLSAGTLRFTALAALLADPIPTPALLIDNPEIGLHPYSTTVAAYLMKKASRTVPVITATHSPQLVDEVRPEELVCVERQHGATTLRGPDPAALSERLRTSSLGTLWKNNAIGAWRPRI